MIPIPDRLTMKLLVGLGCVLLLVLVVHDRNRWRTKASHYAELLAAERGAHAASAANYRAAAEVARRADKDNAARVKSEQAKPRVEAPPDPVHQGQRPGHGVERERVGLDGDDDRVGRSKGIHRIEG